MNVVATDSSWFWQAAKQHESDPQLLFVDPVPWFCDKQNCRYASESGELFYRDGDRQAWRVRFVAGMLPATVLTPSVQSVHAR